MAEKNNENLAVKRLSSLFDDGVYTALDSACGNAAIGFGSVDGATVFAYAEGGGAFNSACAAKLVKVYDLAEKTGSPVVVILDSSGSSLTEGTETLDACSLLMGRIARISGVVPQIAVVCGTCGGFSALCASMADLCVMDSEAQLFLTAPFLTGRDSSAKNSGQEGIASVVCKSDEVFSKTRSLIGVLPLNNLDVSPVFSVSEPVFDPADAVASIADCGSAVELFADYGKTGTYLASVGGKTVGISRINGKVGDKDCRKIARLTQLCDAFSLPIINIVDSEGFCSSCSTKDAALLACTYATASTVKLSVVTGNAIGSVYSIFCGKGSGNDIVYVWPDAVLAPVTPSVAAVVFSDDEIEKQGDLEKLAKEYAGGDGSARKALERGSADMIISPEATRNEIVRTVDMLVSKRVQTLPKKHSNLPY